jgi:hypothetical protein
MGWTRSLRRPEHTLSNRLSRLALTQFMKRSPVNLRPLLRVPVTQNPKGIALFLAASIKLARAGALDGPDIPGTLAQRLLALRSPRSRYWCWGYSFPWQTRTMLVPRGAPNLVCTCFAADALLDAHAVSGDPACLAAAVSAAHYILSDLYRSSDGRAWFSYPLPSATAPVHNATLLASAFLCRVADRCGDRQFVEPALSAARSAAARQREDGSWYYGEAPRQRWVDNFHSGYNLCALHRIAEHVRTDEFDGHVRRGYRFYRRRLITEDGVPRYFADRTYPIDSHATAQSILTLLALRDLDASAPALARAISDWALDRMWDSRGYFYYQAHRAYTNRIPYMRWTQAWMLLALAGLLEQAHASHRRSTGRVEPRSCRASAAEEADR